jgi:hypothetical protein
MVNRAIPVVLVVLMGLLGAVPCGLAAAQPSAAEKALQSRVDLDFERTSLDNVLRYIKELEPAFTWRSTRRCRTRGST